TLILIILIALIFPAVEQNYKIFILSGLLFSLLGDLFLIYPEQHFKKGLLAFLAGHVCYIFAFTVSSGFHFTSWIFFPIVIVGVLYLRIILPYSGDMKIPMVVYIIVITIMGWMAIERLNSILTLGAILATSGAVSFMISDAVLALNKFKKSFNRAELIILTTYYTAQWLLAVSTIVT
ncbi:MAG: lysoplasmalogenase, partial [Planctomycetia bacterium]|nr:lysoplasmalogenase [Planctomycetia bacterium]